KVDVSKQVAVENRPEIDRWILALAHQTVKVVTDSLDTYQPKRAGEAIESLVDQLSNWYVRRNRRRFWKGEAGDDKQAAYLTLYEVLDLVHRLIAPFMPFLSDNMYQNLVTNIFPDQPESVHLTTWPKANDALLDDQLVREMNVIQRVVGLGRSTREKSQVRVRQPLSRILVRVPNQQAQDAVSKHLSQVLEELNIKEVDFIAQDADIVSYAVKPKLPEMGKVHGKLVPAIKAALAQADGAMIAGCVAKGESFSVDVAGNAIEFGPADVVIQTASAEGYASAEEGDFLVALETQITPELAIEGTARELVRSVQDARKNAGLEIADRIVLNIDGSKIVGEAIAQYKDYIMTETLAVEWAKTDSAFEVKGEADGQSWTVTLSKSG
ncbi:MAG: isoleucyl-tRNA synthetase, partial [Saprospiraceae bacterium]